MSQPSKKIRDKVRQNAGNRCGYCLSQQRYVLGPLEIEHIIPQAAGGSDDEENLWLACRLYNNYKHVQTKGVDPLSQATVKLFNPRKQIWSDHFQWEDGGVRIQGKTACGRATVIALQLNNIIAVTVRRAWISAGWYPPA